MISSGISHILHWSYLLHHDLHIHQWNTLVVALYYKLQKIVTQYLKKSQETKRKISVLNKSSLQYWSGQTLQFLSKIQGMLLGFDLSCCHIKNKILILTSNTMQTWIPWTPLIMKSSRSWTVLVRNGSASSVWRTWFSIQSLNEMFCIFLHFLEALFHLRRFQYNAWHSLLLLRQQTCGI